MARGCTVVVIKTYNLKETADLLHVSYTHAKNHWREWGGVKLGRRVIFSEEAIRELLCSTNSRTPSITTSSSSIEASKCVAPLAARISEMRRDLKAN